MTDDTVLAKPFGWRFVSPLMLGSALNPINSSMIATALVGIGSHFGVATGQTALLISVLYLCSAVAQPTLGKLSTVIGSRRTFLGGLALLVVAGIIGVTAPSFGFLVLSRALIGIGTSACYPTAMALIRGRADANGGGVPTSVLGSLTIAAQITATFGLPIGGVLVGAFGWRAIFAVNIPLAIITIVLTLIGVPKDELHTGNHRGGLLVALDLPGIALFAGTIVSLLIFLSNISVSLWWLAVVFVALLAGLYFWERHASRPLIDFRMLAANRPLQRTYLRSALVNLGQYSVLIGVSQWLEEGRGLSASATGLLLLPLTAVGIFITRFVSKRGLIRWPLIIGGIAQVAAGAAMLFITHDTSLVLILGMIIVLSGFAFGTSANQSTLYIQSPPEQVAVASGLYRTFNYMGAIFSSIVLSVAYGPAASDAGFHRLGWVLLGIGVAIVAMVVVDRRIPARANA